MTIVHRELEPHQSYFQCLESDIQALSRWIDFSQDNELVYSIELARLLMTAAAEADVIAKRLCHTIDPARRASSINVYQSVLCAALPALPAAIVEMPRYGMEFRPWSNWATENTPPDWWQGNNKVKHHRAEHFKQANLKNVLNAVAGLALLLLLYYRSQGIHHVPPPNLFWPRTFGMPNGAQFLILIPDGSNVPWA